MARTSAPRGAKLGVDRSIKITLAIDPKHGVKEVDTDKRSQQERAAAQEQMRVLSDDG